VIVLLGLASIQALVREYPRSIRRWSAADHLPPAQVESSDPGRKIWVARRIEGIDFMTWSAGRAIHLDRSTSIAMRRRGADIARPRQPRANGCPTTSTGR
jgi:hypothetical protein